MARDKTQTGPDPIDVAVGARIRVRRREVGMSQEGLAKQLSLTFQQVQKYERGANRVSASMLVHTARALACSAASLLGEDGSPIDMEGDTDVATALGSSQAKELLLAFVKIKERILRNAILSLTVNAAMPLASVEEAKGEDEPVIAWKGPVPIPTVTRRAGPLGEHEEQGDGAG
jgi:transcriptional regulator with XRE-family HTH domain